MDTAAAVMLASGIRPRHCPLRLVQPQHTDLTLRRLTVLVLLIGEVQVIMTALPVS
jgi:hypothetical protein